MPPTPSRLTCASCGCAGSGAETALWSWSRPPRPTGSTGARSPEQERTTALCPNCARRRVRDLEARLDP